MIEKVLLASNNLGKIRELQSLLGSLGIEIVSQSDYGIAAPEETGLSFVENAILKARHAARHSGLPAIGDDSGLEVDALDGAPGIHSARYAGSGATDRDNINKLLRALAGVEPAWRKARFRCVMAFLRHADDPSPILAEGIWQGLILEACRGSGGFGYDPVFWVPEAGCSAAELAPEEKNRLSHRGLAARLLAERIREHL
ncbi:MAG TPA: RdgB/HAM1 family non-canonical purine NTP pyrophosphatase [Methylococcus sp.]|nr:RdgB/HAM1 family non-canonical purine NTP pyrophosphatase [Methylococcus sp.]